MSDISKLGRDLDIYTTVSYIGKGFPIILPRGAKLIKILRNYVEREEEKNGYRIVRTPSMSNSEIYKIEDRYELEKENLFVIQDMEDESKNAIVLKPHVAPFHCAIYSGHQHSYKQLPRKYCETSTVFRNVRDIKGIIRTRQITMSDASIFCEPQKIEKEIRETIEMQQKFIERLDLDVSYVISTWNGNEKENYIGTIEEWNNTVQAMKKALSDLSIPYSVDNKAKMYGPSIKVKYNNKEFSNLQVDFEITHRFDIKYTDKDNKEKFPSYIHHTVVGSYEKMISILLEKYSLLCEKNKDYDIETFIKEVEKCLTQS